jgi:hypothetical protein
VNERFVVTSQTDKGVVYGGVTVRVKAHGCADDVCTLGTGTVQQSHVVHGVKQLAVRGLKAVDFGNSTRNDNAHRIGHEVLFERFVYSLQLYFRFLDRLFDNFFDVFLARHNTPSTFRQIFSNK